MQAQSVPPAFAVVVVHYGDTKITEACLASLADQLRADDLLVLVNNGGAGQGQELAQALERLFSGCARLTPSAAPARPDPGQRALLLEPAANRGFAAGCNAGLHAALACPGITHAWLLNNDTELAPGAVQALRAGCAQRPDDILGATVLRASAPGTLQLAAGVRYQPSTSRIAPAHAGAPLSRVPALAEPRLDYVYGASMCIPAALLRRVGLLDEGYFLFYEELDFCRRAVDAGARLGWCRGCHVLHRGGEAIGREGEAEQRRLSFAAYHEARSTLRFTRRRHPRSLASVLAARLLAKPALLALRGRWRSIPAALRGAWDGLRTPL